MSAFNNAAIFRGIGSLTLFPERRLHRIGEGIPMGNEALAQTWQRVGKSLRKAIEESERAHEQRSLEDQT